MENENIFLLHALLMGIFITFVYDILRIFRRVIPHKAFFVSLEDLCFWIFCGAEVFLLMHRESNGTLRWFAVLGALAGMLLYKKLIGRFFVKYTSAALSWLLRAVGKVLGRIFRPFVILAGKTGRSVRKAGSGTRRIAGRIERRIKNRLTRFLKVFKMSLKK